MVVVGVAVQVVAVDSQSTGHHHTLDGASAAVLGNGRAAVVSIRFPAERREREAHSFILQVGLCIYFRVGVR